MELTCVPTKAAEFEGLYIKVSYLTSGFLHILCFVAYFYKLLSDTRDFILADRTVFKISFSKAVTE